MPNEEPAIASAQPPEAEPSQLASVDNSLTEPTTKKESTSAEDRLARMEATLDRLEKNSSKPKEGESDSNTSWYKRISPKVWSGLKETTKFALLKVAPVVFILSFIGNKADEVSACIEAGTQQVSSDTESLIAAERTKLGKAKKADERMEIMLEIQRLQAQKMREETDRMRDQALVPAQCLQKSVPHTKQDLKHDAGKAIERFVEVPSWVGKLFEGKECPPDIKPEKNK